MVQITCSQLSFNSGPNRRGRYPGRMLAIMRYSMCSNSYGVASFWFCSGVTDTITSDSLCNNASRVSPTAIHFVLFMRFA
eukprot:1873731-Rhodomonas_salina.1